MLKVQPNRLRVKTSTLGVYFNILREYFNTLRVKTGMLGVYFNILREYFNTPGVKTGIPGEQSGRFRALPGRRFRTSGLPPVPPEPVYTGQFHYRQPCLKVLARNTQEVFSWKKLS